MPPTSTFVRGLRLVWVGVNVALLIVTASGYRDFTLLTFMLLVPPHIRRGQKLIEKLLVCTLGTHRSAASSGQTTGTLVVCLLGGQRRTVCRCLERPTRTGRKKLVAETGRWEQLVRAVKGVLQARPEEEQA